MTLLAERPRVAPVARRPDPTPREIIEAARNAPATARGAAMLCFFSGIALWAAFPPLDFGPLGWVALVPLVMLTRIERPTRLMYRMAYFGGLVFWVPALQWMRLGDPTMYVAWGLLAGYLAMYFPAFVWIVRRARQQYAVPIVVSVPAVWVGFELLRGHLFTGFGWYMLAHTQYRWTTLIQFSDLIGTYGVSFLMAAVAALAVEAMPTGWFLSAGLLPADATNAPAPKTLTGRELAIRSAAVSVGMLAVLVYGTIRLQHAPFENGPRVALIQSNAIAHVNTSPTEAAESMHRYFALTGKAMQQQPEVIVWPEGMFSIPLFTADEAMDQEAANRVMPGLQLEAMKQQDSEAREQMHRIARMSRAALLLGGSQFVLSPQKLASYNSVHFVTPRNGVAGRYDKLHRVIFGEYLPFVEYLPFLRHFTPYRGEFGIQAGSGSAVFEFGQWRFSPVICYEDTVPHVVSGIVASTRHPVNSADVDFLVNASNDGWFHGSSEHDQHLITAAFRCVETRVPMVRAANTGISAFIDGDGVVRQRARDISVEDDNAGAGSKMVEAVVAGHVLLDPRSSLYVAGGDWFAGICLMFCGFIAVRDTAGRFLRRQSGVTSAVSTAA